MIRDLFIKDLKSLLNLSMYILPLIIGFPAIIIFGKFLFGSDQSSLNAFSFVCAFALGPVWLLWLLSVDYSRHFLPKENNMKENDQEASNENK